MAAATQPPHSSISWMQAPAVPQLGPQGGDPLTPLLPAGADPFAQQPPQSGQHSPGQQKQLHREPLRLREPLCLFLPYQTPPVAAGILGLFRQRLAAGHHGADLPLRVLPGLHSLPQAPAPGLCPPGRTGGLLSPLGDQGLHRRRCGYSAPSAPPGAWAGASSPAPPVRQPDACRRGGTAGRHDRFSEYVRSYRLRKIQAK